MDDKSLINLNANTTGQVDSDSDEKGQIIRYTYKIKYIRLPPDATEEEQALILSSPTNIGPGPKSETGVSILETFSDETYTYYKYSNGQISRYKWIDSRGSYDARLSEEEYKDAKLSAFNFGSATYRDIRKAHNTQLLSLNRPKGVNIGDVIVVEVSNNLGLPIYNYSQPKYFHVGQITEERAIKLTQQAFKNDPPKISYPSSNIYTIDEQTEDIVINEDFQNQQYPPEGSEVIITGDEPLPYTFNSIIVDSKTKSPISQATITDPNGVKVQTNSKGEFQINGEYIPGNDFKLTIYKPGKNPSYQTLEKSIVALTGEIRNDFNYIELSPRNSTSSTILKTKSTSEATISRIEGEVENKNYISSVVKKVSDDISNRVTPYIINELLYKPFGIEDPIGIIESAELTITKFEYEEAKKQISEEEIQAEADRRRESAQNYYQQQGIGSSIADEDIFEIEDRSNYDEGIINNQREGWNIVNANEGLKFIPEEDRDKYEVVGNEVIAKDGSGRLTVLEYDPNEKGEYKRIDGKITWVPEIPITSSIPTGSIPIIPTPPTGSIDNKFKPRKFKIQKAPSKSRYNAQKAYKRKGRGNQGYVFRSGKSKRSTFSRRGKNS